MKKKIGIAVALLVVVVVAAGNVGRASTRCLAGAGASPPAGARAAPWQLNSAGVCLQAFEWKPAAAEVRGVVVVIHGIRDHATRYAGLAAALTAKGFAVYSHDLRGHGHSGGRRQRFDSMEQLLVDVDVVVREARTRNPGRPVFVYGHSLGGLIATHYALAHQKELAGLVLSGAALKLLPTVSSGQIAAARVFGTVLPNLPAQPVDDNEFVSTPEAKAEFMKDPLIDHSNLPARSAKTGVNAIEAVGARMEELALPVLIMHGGDDRATNIAGSRELHRRAKSTDKTLAIYEKQFHDLIHEPARERIIADVVAWVESHVPRR